ncbi:F-BAR and double SH3 domains protein 1 isoform X2 [Malaclemys terrapin pileata]|uniref:F-BAR and double SH3 domains protein 1 isoform X2 n=1 Tax=Malaclemys terrapin pileata TaxID=2991368 RepID=UPI0023A8C015|nr:F-BAR and double SH3 domains protein 1 isoform X2 [Malaclemys terrapin pileata]
MQPPPRKVKLTQEVKVRFIEQLSSLQSKQQRETELLEDIRSYSKQRSAIEREYGQALQRLASQFLKRDWQRGRSETNDSRSAFAVWKGAIDSTVCAGQARVAASENYRSLSLEVAKTTRLSKEHLLKKSTEQLQRVQAELLETVKEVGKAKKRYMHLQRVSEVAKEKAADVEARLRKSDHGIFHTKASLQKLSTKFSVQLSENSQQLVVARNEYLLTLGAANAHLGHYYHVELPAVMKTLDGDLYERLRDHLTLVSQSELEACHATQERFRGILEASTQVCREQSLLLFLQDNTAFTPTPEQQFQPSGADHVCLLEARSGSAGESGLEKEARRWATRAARDYKIKTHGKQVLQRMEARRQQAPEAEMPGMERRMEEVSENIRKAEVSRVKADARLVLLRQAGLDVDTWLAGAMGQVLEELEQERRLSEARKSDKESTPTAEEFDLAEFDDYDDNEELFEDAGPCPGTARIYPSTCRVFFGYQACQSDELSIRQGEELEVIEDGDVEEWVKARNQAGQVGYVPEKYLLFLDAVGSERRALTGSCQEGPSETALEKELTSIMTMDLVLEPGTWLVRALYDYEGQSVEELTFPEGAIIRVLPREEGEVDDGFWKGDFNGRVGVFPSLVVEEITGVIGVAGQELPSPSPPAFSPPVLVPSAGLGSHPLPEVLLGACRQDGAVSGPSSPDLGAARIRPLRAPPPPPAKAPEPEPEPRIS